MNDSDDQGQANPLLAVADVAQSEYLHTVLVHSNYELQAVPSARDAHAALEADAPRIVVVDVRDDSNADEELARFIDSAPRLAALKQGGQRRSSSRCASACRSAIG